MTCEACELEAIRNTMAIYNTAGDRMRLKEMADTFTEDGVLETANFRLIGRAAIIAGLGGDGKAAEPTKRAPSFVRHNLTTSLLELTGPETAEGRTYFIVYTDIGADHMGFYTDKLRKVGGRWLLEYRRVLIDWLAENTLFESLIDNHRARLAGRGAAAAR